MYYIFGIFIGLAILCLLLNLHRARCIRKKVCGLSDHEKNQLLNELIEPFGFAYDHKKDIFTSRIDAWQREFGYCALYDRAAPHAQMIFDCEPIYFDANGHTFLLELWKGQYGINTGAEIGLYRADGLVAPSDYGTTLFHAVEDDLMPHFSMELWQGQTRLFAHRAQHWWLTGFLMGRFSCPAKLTLKASVTFSDYEMLEAFRVALAERGYSPDTECSNCCTVTFCLDTPHGKQPCSRLPLTCRFSQWKNKCFCRLFLWATRPFCTAADRLLYLYYFLPFAFRRTIQVCKPRRYHTRWSRSGKPKRHSRSFEKKCRSAAAASQASHRR